MHKVNCLHPALQNVLVLLSSLFHLCFLGTVLAHPDTGISWKNVKTVVDGWKYSIIIGGCGNFFIYYKIVLRKSVYSAKKVENLVPRTGVLLAPHEVPKRCRNDVVSQHRGRCDPKALVDRSDEFWIWRWSYGWVSRDFGVTHIRCDAHPVLWGVAGVAGFLL